MRIVFVTDTYDGLGGGVVTAQRFVEALRRDHDVLLVSTGNGRPDRVRLPAFFFPQRAMREQRFAFAWPVRSTLEDAFRGADLVHLQFPFLLGLRALPIARRVGVPVVAGFHVQPENILYSLHVRSPCANRALYRLWMRHFYNRADAVICPSPFAERLLRAYGLRVPSWIVSNGTPIRWEHAAPRTSPGTGAPVTLLCVGRLVREKRLDVVLEAVAASRHRTRIKLVLTGAGPLETELRRRAAGLGLKPEIGYVSEHRLQELYAAATLFVHASEVELEGMAVLDAVGAGLPPLVADAPTSAASHFAPDKAFLFRTGDPRALAERLDALLEDPATLTRASATCLAMARRYDFDSSVTTLERVYAAVIHAACSDSPRPLDGLRAPTAHD